MTIASVRQRLVDAPRVRETIMRAAAGEGSYAMAHAWLFTGPPGAGRSHAAVAFAAALECTDATEVGCGRCESCRKVFADAHTDVVHIRPQELSISVETVRGIIQQASRLPTVGRWRVIIVDEADRFSTAAADAFLKTVEEPPASTVIILCAPSTDPEDFSPTLRSRCRHLYIPAPSEAEIVRLLTAEEGADEATARLAAATSLHHIGRARRLIRSEEMQQRRAQVINLAELIFHGDEAFKAVGSLIKAAEKEAVASHEEADTLEREKLEQALGVGAKGKGAARALRGAASTVKALETKQKARGTRRTRDVLDLVLVDLAGVYRDALVIGSGAAVGLTHPDFEGLAREIAQRVPAEGIVACLDAIAACRQSLDFNVTPAVAFFGMLGRIRQACNVK
ncbi:DNA polymerase III subunit delta' [Corynebacterium liangguodongii]|uniref:DNA polymerase III subunit delta n=1 Tax=Corynebacterium liangguodongii TaxID=2079535 RepID=A0A2S0WBU5_9CORY|nr:DNA polymerase III subunit delta' [Corynebacterium liangguodongii]AWB83237.1 DNA polymerase III subunit delta' [Corynebacterium liangguodongii]PWB98665.1 DNA polymerase III subunit delta' [Corynebacterium liangguodongii]